MVLLRNINKVVEIIKIPKEVELYKIITTFGKSFELYYGYYEDVDKLSRYSEQIDVLIANVF